MNKYFTNLLKTKNRRGAAILFFIAILLLFINYLIPNSEVSNENSNNSKGELHTADKKIDGSTAENPIQSSGGIDKSSGNINSNNVDNHSKEDLYTVNKVIDGDTIEVVKDNEVLKIRYIGVDTPETVRPNSPAECYSKEASEFNKTLILNKRVRLESDVEDVDRYGRKLRYVYLEDNQMVNKILIEKGYAYALIIPPNVKYKDFFLQSERDARNNKVGLWAKCK